MLKCSCIHVEMISGYTIKPTVAKSWQQTRTHGMFYNAVFEKWLLFLHFLQIITMCIYFVLFSTVDSLGSWPI